jgi:excisionase family DNA binding protein
MSSQYITVRETAQILAVSEKKVMDLIESGSLQAYKIADQFLRLKRNEVVNIRSTGQVVSENSTHSYTWGERVHDFFYFYDFYLISLVVIGILLYIIFYASY